MNFQSHIALWNLTTVNIIVALFLSPFTFIFNSEIAKNGYYKLFYRVSLQFTIYLNSISYNEIKPSW